MLQVLRKASPSADQRRIERLIAGQEKNVRLAFQEFLKNARSDAAVKQVREALEKGNLEGALRAIDPYVVRFSNAITSVFTGTAAVQAEQLVQQLGGFVAIGFDPTYPRAVALMRRNRLEFIASFTRQQRDATRSALIESFNKGEGPRVSARVFRDSVGLTKYQLGVVNNYRKQLETGSKQALDRELRDRRSDKLIERTFDDGDLLSADQIERMVGRYTQNMLNLRAETIARTETIKIANQARQEATKQIMEQAGLKPDDIVRTWLATQDERTRDTHAEMHGQERALDEYFETPTGVRLMYPGDPDSGRPEEFINCRCVLSVHIPGVGGGTDVEVEE